MGHWQDCACDEHDWHGMWSIQVFHVINMTDMGFYYVCCSLPGFTQITKLRFIWRWLMVCHNYEHELLLYTILFLCGRIGNTTPMKPRRLLSSSHSYAKSLVLSTIVELVDSIQVGMAGRHAHTCNTLQKNKKIRVNKFWRFLTYIIMI